MTDNEINALRQEFVSKEAVQTIIYSVMALLTPGTKATQEEKILLAALLQSELEKLK